MLNMTLNMTIMQEDTLYIESTATNSFGFAMKIENAGKLFEAIEQKIEFDFFTVYKSENIYRFCFENSLVIDINRADFDIAYLCRDINDEANNRKEVANA